MDTKPQYSYINEHQSIFSKVHILRWNKKNPIKLSNLGRVSFAKVTPYPKLPQLTAYSEKSDGFSVLFVTKLVQAGYQSDNLGSILAPTNDLYIFPTFQHTFFIIF